MTESKSILKSKTVWLALIPILTQALTKIQDIPSIPENWQSHIITITSILIVLARFTTSEPVHLLKAKKK